MTELGSSDQEAGRNTGHEIKFCLNDVLFMCRLCSAYFAQTIICFPKMFLPIGSNFHPVQSKEKNF